MARKVSRKTKPRKGATPTAARRRSATIDRPRKTARKSQSRNSAKPALLAGGNPQIAKAYGDAPVQTYIEAMPGWKRDVGRRLDALITRAHPDGRKAPRPVLLPRTGGWI